MGRVTLAEEMKKVLDFLTINGYVNFGILERVPKHFNLDYWKVGLISFWNLNVPYYCYLLISLVQSNAVLLKRLA